MPKEVKVNGGGGGSSSRGGNQDGSDKFQLDDLNKRVEKMTLMERRRAGKPAASDSSMDGSSPTSSIEEGELKVDSPSTRRLEGRKKAVIGGSLSSADADVSSSSLSTSTDGEVEMCLSSSSPTSFNWNRINGAGSKVKTSTPKDKGFHAGGAGDGDGGVCVAAPAFEPPAGFDREDGGYGGGDGDGYGEGLGGGSNSDWFGLAAPKFGTPVPNRIFIGGISCQTTENDLVRIFSKYGEVRGAKIILDRGGVSKGYGFVTFETAEEATALCDSIVNKTFEPIILRDRRLNIAPAIKKQPGICSDSGFSSEGSLQRPGGHYSGPHNNTGGYYYPNQYQLAPPPHAPIQPQYYDFPQPASSTGNQYLEQYLQHYAAAAAAAYAQPMTSPPAHQPQPGAYAVPQYYAAAPAQAPAQMTYYEGGAPTQYQYPVAAGSWADWSSAPMIPGVPAYYYNYPAWDPNSGIPEYLNSLQNHVQYQ